MWIIDVIPISNSGIKKSLSYYSPFDVLPGQLVSIPLNKKIGFGIVLFVYDVQSMKLSLKDNAYILRKISAVHQLFVTPELLSTANKIARKFLITFPEVISKLLPKSQLEIGMIRNGGSKPLLYTHGSGKINTFDPKISQSSIHDRILSYISMYMTLKKKGLSLCIILPTWVQVENFSELLSRNIDKCELIIVHAHQSKNKQKNTILELSHSDTPKIVISTPSFFTITSRILGSIVIEDEASQYYQLGKFQPFDWRHFFYEYAREAHISVVFGGDILSFDCIDASRNKRLYSNTRSLKIFYDAKPFVHDTHKIKLGNKQSLMFPRTLDAIHTTLEEGGSVYCYVPKLGYASTVTCLDCGSTFTCETCKKSLVLRTRNEIREFYCKQCDKINDHPLDYCSLCEGQRLSLTGITLERVYEYLSEELKPGTKIQLLSQDILTKKHSRDKALVFTTPTVFIGTHGAVPYIEGQISLSIITSIDPIALFPDVKAYEIALYQIIKVAKSAQNRTILETRNTPFIITQAFGNKNISDWFRAERTARMVVEEIPYKTKIVIRYASKASSLEKNQLNKQIGLYIESYANDSISIKYEPSGINIYVDPSMWELFSEHSSRDHSYAPLYDYLVGLKQSRLIDTLSVYPRIA